MAFTHSALTLVFCALAALALLIGAEGASVSKRGKGQSHKGTEAESEENIVKLLLDPSMMTPSVPLRPIQDYSLSPWTYNFTTNENLFPSSIAEAKCKLTGCLNSKGVEVMDLESRPIYHQILVLRRVDLKSGNYVFRLETKTIPVGCTCIYPSIMRQD
ncbi:interleukin 17a/f1 [Megalops cyprinoides]|uniref:interleukin 17a/f1 n=1 Tax=Megalops cyprinoides TaxID=118141 RepID=UPI001864C6D0|nr:interleukin 17a/f1 [Megalops cyprinoides]